MWQVEICSLNLLFIDQILGWTRFCSVNTEQNLVPTQILKMYSEETIPSFHECLPLLGFIMSKKQERLRSELLSEDKITNLLGFLT